MAEEDSAPSAPTRSTDLLEAFWKFLALTEVVDAEVIEEYRSQYADKWMPLTTILVEEGVIEANQVAMLLRKQFSEPHMRLGDLAVREEFCTREDVDRAAVLQEERCPHPIDLLLGDERVEASAAVDALKNYVHHLEGRVRSLERQLAGESVIRVHRP